ncbi:MAG: hypothetical protein H6818_17895 [Phycisphaerales bacterium]|nr:hypothetical protein [Phycisphaerales bacterium]
MPAYVVCPHCGHPSVISVTAEGRRYRCRQCNGYYLIRQTESAPRSTDRNSPDARHRTPT